MDSFTVAKSKFQLGSKPCTVDGAFPWTWYPWFCVGYHAYMWMDIKNQTISPLPPGKETMDENSQSWEIHPYG